MSTRLCDETSLQCSECPSRINSWFSSLPGVSATLITRASPIVTITYHPSPFLTIRNILAVPQPLTAGLYKPPSLFARARALQAKEAKKLSLRFAVAAVLAIPTFIFGIVGLVLLPQDHPFRQWCSKPVWGIAARAVVILGCLATVTQFGVGRYVHPYLTREPTLTICLAACSINALGNHSIVRDNPGIGHDSSTSGIWTFLSPYRPPLPGLRAWRC